ncbi:uncharacterized protein LOC126570252 [Anopheles aquasalis]|uniref:uncharacterized protein LOC126570252 n=1 Tax=Anopheles aquasalis TaxID=42839 RepID=UPI00215AF189|nr:uncharacterized protein LOC126570252 [Anopheles aquasalis]
MRSLQILVHLLSAALLTQPLLAAPIFWFLPWSFPNFPTSTSSTSGTTSSSSTANGASNSSNVSVAIGNRVNTSTGLDDYGTNITNVQINVNRQRRSVANTILDLNDLDGSGGGGGGGAEADTGGSYISIGEHTVRLPANITNLTLNTYLINGIPVPDDSVLVSNEVGNAGDPSLLVTAIRLFRNFLKSFLVPANG